MIRAAVVGAGAFGKNHARVLSQLPEVRLAAIVDLDLARAQALATQYGTEAFSDVRDVLGHMDAAIVATPTVTHETVAEALLSAGVDVLVEKPIADSAEGGARLTQLAEQNGRILQVGHLERFNPAVVALERACTLPLFFEVHRLSVFTPRSLDVDVVLDLMIHDLDIVLHLAGEEPAEIRAAGISILSPKVDIANVRLSFANGCVANLTASRVSTEQVRKLRMFQPGEYLSVDYGRQDLARLRILPNELLTRDFLRNEPNTEQPSINQQHRIGFEQVPVERSEPLERELSSFFQTVRERSKPLVDGWQATRALRLAEEILGTIKVHAQTVSETIARRIHS
ncbi:MAG TPA: Gfo/Idh/MocA family oxidoreductase [Bryobacteraceae bacterium]|jgi:predicted dehydrogenase|nr:Gfo/Idh/MocA family oxidoreductase [Bryobacteraceae bacterium]